MSIIFGSCRLDGAPLPPLEMERLAAATERYAPDGTYLRSYSNIGMGFQPYHTHSRSHLETQPFSDAQGNIIVFDGRLDSWEELRDCLNLTNTVTDSEIALAGFARWGEDCFSRLIGDWALALWSSADHRMYLARDHAGSRTLYFRHVGSTLYWSTHLETFFTAGTQYSLNEKYISHFLGLQPLGRLTPYNNIHAVPPAHYITIHDDTAYTKAHWNWVADSSIRYKSDADYELQLLALLKQSVARRTGRGAPILAELSGGLDSTTIVSLADRQRNLQNEGAELLDTISYYDDSEPNWNEKPYFSAVEELRGKVGIHVDTSTMSRSFAALDDARGLYLLPGEDSASIQHERLMQQLLAKGKYRVILSGIGGDEVLGGVPDPLPELADHLIATDIARFAKRSTDWAIATRTPILHLFARTMKFIVKLHAQSHVDRTALPPWLHRQSRELCLETLHPRSVGHHGLSSTPSAISNGMTWWQTMETLPHLNPSALTRQEYRYPFLDRDLVDFLFRIPREQLVQPGRRRSLMRKTLRGIVPEIILERRRKAYVSRGLNISLRDGEPQIRKTLADPLIGKYGFVDTTALLQAYDRVRSGIEPRWSIAIIRAINLELWLSSASQLLPESDGIIANGNIYVPNHRDHKDPHKLRCNSI